MTSPLLKTAGALLLLALASCTGTGAPDTDTDAFDGGENDEKDMIDITDEMTADDGIVVVDEDLPLSDDPGPDNADDIQIDDDLMDEDPAPDDDLLLTDEATDETSTDADTSPSFPACGTYGSPVATATLTHADLKEISGVAVSWRNPGIVWTHNDSGGAAALFAIGFDGTIHATLSLTGAVNTDWEDLALAPCGIEECLYVADVGDNLIQRDDCGIIRVVEPLLTEHPDGAIIETADWEQFPLSYSDGPHNTEAFAMHPDGTLYLFTKEIGRTVVFKAGALDPLDTLFSPIGEIDTGIEVPGYPAEAQPSLVTAADIHRNGDRILLRTYGVYTTDNDGVFEFRVAPGAAFDSFLTAQKLTLPEGADMQGEAIAYDPIAGGYLHTSEYYFKIVDFNPKIYRIGCTD